MRGGSSKLCSIKSFCGVPKKKKKKTSSLYGEINVNNQLRGKIASLLNLSLIGSDINYLCKVMVYRYMVEYVVVIWCVHTS